MICLLAGNYHEAKRYASSQDFEDDEWFYPENPSELYQRSNFHVLVVGTAGQNVPASYFERVWSLAKMRGRIGR